MYVPFRLGAGIMVVSMYGLCFGCRGIGDSCSEGIEVGDVGFDVGVVGECGSGGCGSGENIVESGQSACASSLLASMVGVSSSK